MYAVIILLVTVVSIIVKGFMEIVWERFGFRRQIDAGDYVTSANYIGDKLAD